MLPIEKHVIAMIIHVYKMAYNMLSTNRFHYHHDNVSINIYSPIYILEKN